MVPSRLVELGRRALCAVESSVAGGAPRLRCQLLASDFYETLKQELRETSQADFARRSTLIAAARHCSRMAAVGISPAAMLSELRTAVAALQSDQPEAPRQPELRPLLRVIEGGRAGL